MERWRSIFKKTPAARLWFIIWAGALAVPYLSPWGLLGAGLGVWLSAAALAPGRFHGRRLIKGAFIFGSLWSLIMGAAALMGPGDLRPLARLWVWLGLGLNLMLAKTPLELALPAGQILVPVIGRVRAQKLALALALTARLIPRLIDSALKIRTSLNLRAARLPLTRRLSLWGSAIMRDLFSQSEEMARALVKRWPWA